jgi:hypothetical protein
MGISDSYCTHLAHILHTPQARLNPVPMTSPFCQNFVYKTRGTSFTIESYLSRFTFLVKSSLFFILVPRNLFKMATAAKTLVLITGGTFLSRC